MGKVIYRTIKNREDWFALTRFGNKKTFNKVKIVSPGEVKNHKFAIDETKSGFSCARVFAITSENNKYNIKYILSLLNSKVCKFFLQSFAPLK